MAINEQDAFQVFNAYKANLIPDELKPKAKQMLDDYRSQQVQRMQSVFSDLKTLDAEDGSFITADRFSPGAGDKLRKKEANILWLSNRYNAPETDVRKRYDLYKAEAATEWGQAGLDDESFFSRASQEVGKQKKQIQLIQSAQEAAFLSAVNGGDDVADFSAWQFANPDPESFTGTARSAWEEERKRTLNRLGPDGQGLAARVVRSLRHETGVAREEDAWLNQTVEMLTQLKATDPDKYNLVMSVANAKAQKAAKPEKAVAEGAVEAFGRSSADIIAGIPRFLVEASAEGSARFVESGQDRVLSKIGLPVSENPELLAKRIRARSEIQADLQDLARGVIDPIESRRKGWAKYAEDAVYMFAGSAPTMVAPLIPGGQAALTGMFANESYEDFRRAGWDGPGALGAALATGRIQAAIERVSESAMAIPGVASWMAKYGAKPGMSFVKTFLARTVTRSISEGAEEALQQATAPAAQELGSAIFASIPDRPEGQKLKDVMSEFMKLDNSIPLMLSILPLGALGAGISTQNDMVLVATITRDPRLLRAVMSEAEAKKIEQEANPQVRAEMIKKAWQATPTSDIITRIKALVQDDVKRVEEAKNVLAEAEKTGLIPRIRRDAEGWKVEQNGQMVRVDSRETAVQMAYSSLDDLERQQYESMALVADELLNDKEAMEISGSQQTLKGLVDAKLITPQEAAKRAQLAAQMAGMTKEEAQNASWIVLGKNTIEQINNVRTAVSRIYHGANVITQIHEHAHGRWATALHQGYLTHDDGVQFVRLAEQATGLQFLPVADDAKVSPQMLDEAIVEVVSADTVGRRKTDKRFTPGVISRGIAAFIKSEKQQQLRKRVAGKMDGRGLARFKAFMSSYREFWGVVLRNARALKKARDEGKIGEDFDTFLEALLGTDTQTRVEAEAIQEVGQMVEEVDNQPFSLAPARTAQDAEYLAAVESGDMEKAQRMVDEAAKAAGYEIQGWHGSAEDFTEFKIKHAAMFAAQKEKAAKYGDIVRRFYLKSKAPAKGVSFQRVQGMPYDFGGITTWAKQKGRDSAVTRYKSKDGEIAIFSPSQIKSADPVTYDDAGNVIPLSQRFQPESPDIRFSLARATSLVEVADTILASRMKKPEFKEGFYIAARRRLERLAKQKNMQGQGARESQLGAIRTLNAILSAFSPAIRGEVVGGNMGFINLAELKTDAARAKEITRVLNKLEDILEREAKKYYTDKIERMLERAQLKGKPGEVKKSDFIVTVQDELNLIQVAVDLDTDEVQTGITAAEAELMTADTPEKADSAMARMHLLETFGALFDEKNTTSAEMEVASDYLEQLMKQGREARRMLDEERRNKVKAYVEAASKDVFNGEIGPDTTQEARMKAAKKSGRTLLKKFFQEGLSYDLVLRYLFGADSKTAQEFGDRFILNSNAFEDTQNERRKRLRDFSRELYKTKLGARINQKLMALDTKQANTAVTYLKGREVVTHKMDLDQAAKVVADPKAFGFTAADAKAISAELDAINTRNADPTQRKVKRLVYEQTVKTGDRVEIPLSQMDALYLSMALRQPGILEQQERYGYDQKTVDELENFLTDEAKSWREWMQEEYDAEYDVANQVYMRLFNTRMPQIKFYAPLLKNHQGNQAALDPLNSGIVAQSANPGSIKSRKARTSSLRIESALDVFWSHFNQMDYWVHMAEYLRDVQSVMLNPMVRDAVVSKHGTEGMQTLNAWITLQLGRGVSKGALVVAGNRMIRNIKSAVSMKALALSLSTTLKTLPSMLYSLGEIHLSKWPAALASGMKHWSRLWNTNIIQRRLDIGGMPELRDLGNSALPMSWVNQGIKMGSYPTMYADGVFTTYSAAMAYGVSFDEAKAQGASDEMAHKHAEERTAIIVSKTAQPENWTQKSLLENDASGAGTLFYLFTSDPRQKAALTFEVFNRLRKGEASLEEASRKFLAYWVLPGMMFQLANAVGRSLFKGDDDEWDVVDFATAALVGQAQGFLLIGSSVEMIVSAAVAAAAEAITGEEVKGKPFWNSPKNPLDQAAQEMVKAAQTLNEDDGKTGLEKAWQLGKAASMGMSWMTPAGAIPSTAERVFKDTSNLFYSEED